MKGHLSRRTRLSAAVAAAALAVPLLATQPQAAIAATAADSNDLIVTLGEPLQQAPQQVAAGLCQGGDPDYNRTESCYIATVPVEVKEKKTGQITGRALLDETSEAKLNPRDRTSWEHKVTLKLHDATGTALAMSGSVTLKCNACRASAGGVTALPSGSTQTFTMTVSSPGTEINTDQMVPVVSVIPNLPGAEAGTGAVGTPIAVRCDNTPYVSPQSKGGCVYPRYTPTYELSTLDGKIDQVAWHIYWAQNNLRQAWGAKGRGPALTRTADKNLIDKNRETACPSSMPRPDGKSCDEYPFASTHQGASKNPDYSCHMVPEKQNTAEGRDYRNPWYKANRILEDDAFWVSITLPPAGVRAMPPAMNLARCPG
ncbi:NucA/NucB deoxyribonuclease domain-containing protein [Streptomyces syringium]|uniref:NucA/NucB deoxyribonuclease domain-containing protein n=1 Tax=Streptomyces syringium TaxID=76729 RepID=UPI0037CCCE48